MCQGQKKWKGHQLYAVMHQGSERAVEAHTRGHSVIFSPLERWINLTSLALKMKIIMIKQYGKVWVK